MAKRFRFRFETLLKLRRQREDEHKRIVGERLAQIAAVREEISRLEQLTRSGVDSVRMFQQAGRIDLQQTMAHRGWIVHLQKASLEAQARLAALEARLAQERAALAEAAKQRRILEKLEERQAHRHELEMRRAEVRTADDLTTTRFVYGELEQAES
ncbi:MAG TPA: flagellar export protein FliJ [Phycisphaerae bacterium]|mgnify:CR=1 FL=1|nr:flagellar export protein FliJ [Phycisphaerae bacterium]HOJ74294.1 flagellar export protein FliJ [Phycisphaerae bacterium]HOM51373.1 flagellar export protein FliJ [Phycisphaerae bacterium]HON66911.1 flagellar export protein FliJ [Phycisphaerae bacterium]HOQ84996.1 flagellar export protein FliJ [Phycisphaerae bacterium]